MSNNFPVASGTSATYSYAVASCSPGDVFTINGTGGNQTRLWAFISATGSVLTKASGGATATNLLVTAPADAAFLIVHGKTAEWVDSYKGDLIIRFANTIKDKADMTADSLVVAEYPVFELGHINTSGQNANANNRIRLSGFVPYDSEAKVNIETDAKFRIFFYSAKSQDAFVFGPNYWYTYSDDDRLVKNIVNYWYSGDVSILKYMRFAIANSNDSTVTDVNALGRKYTLKHSFYAKDVTNITDDMRLNANRAKLGNCSIRCAKEQSYTDGTRPKIEWYLLEEPVTGRFYYSRDLVEKRYLFTFPFKSYRYSFGVLSNGDIIAVLDADAIDTSLGKHDSNRENPYVFLASENWSICHEVDFGSNLKPCGWLSSCGFKVLADGSAIFCEYTRQTTETSNVWRISGNPSVVANWTLTKSFEITSTDNQTNFKHCHMVMQDFYTGICYLSTGDDNVGAMMFYSLDNGQTWTKSELPNDVEGSEKYCRMLTLFFTENYIYWASDTTNPNLHYLFRAGKDANGILDYSTVTDLVHIEADDGTATYGLAYIPELNSLVLLDRADVVTASMDVKLINLTTGTLHVIGTLEKNPYQVSNQHLGFRTRFSEWYPINGEIHFGYGLHINHYNYDINHNKGFGNKGTPEKQGAETINNLIMRVYKNGDGYGFTLDTVYI